MRVYIHDSESKRAIEAAEGSTITDIIDSLEPGVQVWAEDAEEPLAPGATVADLAGGGRAAVHVGKGLVSVQVFYNGLNKSKSFGPGTKVEKVFDWAVGTDAFNIPEVDAQTLALRRHGSSEDLDPDTHVGTLADDQRSLLLDLVPGDRFAG